MKETSPTELQQSCTNNQPCVSHRSPTTAEDLSEEDTETGEFDEVDKQNRPDQSPMGVVEDRLAHTGRHGIQARETDHTYTSDQTGQQEIDTYRSTHPHEIVNPSAKTKDTQIFLETNLTVN